jgi:hypothetical protein
MIDPGHLLPVHTIRVIRTMQMMMMVRRIDSWIAESALNNTKKQKTRTMKRRIKGESKVNPR